MSHGTQARKCHGPDHRSWQQHLLLRPSLLCGEKQFPRSGLFFPTMRSRAPSPAKATPAPSSLVAAGVWAVSSRAVVVIWISWTLPTPRPSSTSWSAFLSNSPTPTSTRSPLPRQHDKVISRRVCLTREKPSFDGLNFNRLNLRLVIIDDEDD